MIRAAHDYGTRFLNSFLGESADEVFWAGVENAACALYEGGVSQKMVPGLLVKYWGIDWNTAEEMAVEGKASVVRSKRDLAEYEKGLLSEGPRRRKKKEDI
ncbi:hypothetical protein CCYS_09605 [Corynebacterium cystitidis DSM 20524]|uniref:Uncharacterized protein n=1 Tax=Corynebacterium cystitidis DSM 20524 TaxID=1121357 RepID=A0A1H9WMC0_9CORY|nr:hypothetical protein CCYS_09605 [Corynebacterium cystitidis DSM 20524]SES35086.1 hypothetical protein SAMN05661109_02816 [Corynebacterium cystitidis DSM 20524]SNV70000.1 Uncharacterised protein [Corynebacterium cystitidis]